MSAKRLQSVHGYVKAKKLLEFLYDLFPKAGNHTEDYRWLGVLLIDFRWLIQMLLFLKPASESNQLMSQFWFLISCIRPDSLLSYAKLAWVWFLLAAIGVGLSWLVLIFLAFAHSVQSLENPLVRKAFIITSRLLTDLISIPTSNGLLVMIFATGDFRDGITPDIESWGKWVAICAYIAYLLYLCVISLARFEIDLQSGKAEVTQDFLSLALVQSTLLSYYVLQPKSYVLHLVLVGLMAGGVTLRHCVHLPYYSETANLTFIWCKGSLASACLGLIVGYFVSSSICGLILLISFSVCLILILYLSFNTYYQNQLIKNSKHLGLHLGSYSYNLGLRLSMLPAIKAEEESEQIRLGSIALEQMNSILSLGARGVLVHILILKHFVLLHALKDERGARLCLCQARQTSDKSLIDLYLIMKCQRRIQQSTDLEEVQYLRYMTLLMEIRHQDEVVCEELKEIWTELGSISPSFHRVISLSQFVDRTIGSLKSEFKQVIKSFPGGFEVYDLFASFLDEVLGKTAKARHWRQKANFYQAEKAKIGQKADSDSVGFFDYTSGIVIVDLSPASFSALLYMNKVALDVLNYDSKDLSILKLSNLIPSPYSLFHEKHIRSFASSQDSADLDHPSQLPLLTSDGFIVFCICRIVFTCTDEHPILMVLFRPMKSLKDGAILSPSLDIEAHSKHFANFLDRTEVVLINHNLANLYPSLVQNRSQIGTSHSFQIFKNRSFYGFFAFQQFGFRRIYYFYTFKTGNFLYRKRMYDVERRTK